MATDLVRVRLEFIVPETKCLYRISKKHPHLLFKNISMLPLPEEMGNTLIETSGIELDELVESVKEEANILSHKIVYQTDDTAMLNIKVEDPLVLRMLTSHDLIIDYPLIIQDGIATANIVGERGNVDAMLLALEEKGIKFTIKSIGPNDPREVLTGKQKELLMKTLQKGFFDVPRKVSLTELAKEFGVSPTALSEMVRRLSKRLAEHYIDSVP